MYRLATPADADHIAALHARSWQETYRGIMPDDYLNDEVEAERLACWRERFLDNPPNRHIIVAEEAGQLAGFSCTILHEDPVYGSLLDNLHVAQAYKGRGIGRQLIQQAAEWVQQQQPDSSFYLWVYEANHAARKFYDSLGAVNHEKIQGEFAPVLRYVWPTVRTLIAPDDLTNAHIAGRLLERLRQHNKLMVNRSSTEETFRSLLGLPVSRKQFWRAVQELEQNRELIATPDRLIYREPADRW